MSRNSLLVLIVAAAAGAIACAPAAEPRAVVLETRGMTFVRPDAPDATNPTLQFRAGEQVKVILRNASPGLLHDFAIPDWNVQSEQIRAGAVTEVTFTAPSTPGKTTYTCRPHAELMQGTIEVTP